MAEVIWYEYFLQFPNESTGHNGIYFCQVTIPFIHNLVVLDADGDRMLAKYYDGRGKAEQIKYEAILHKKSKNITARSEGKWLWG